jgi:hypothetical protein
MATLLAATLVFGSHVPINKWLDVHEKHETLQDFSRQSQAE